MAKPVNPYAPPVASLNRDANEDSPGVWREGKFLIVEKDALLPARCIRCNAPVEKPAKERKVYWHSPWLYLLILVNIIVYAVGALIARKTAKLNPALCATHSTHRLLALWLGIPGAIALIVFMIMAFAYGRFALGGLLATGVIPVMIVVSLKGRLFIPAKITDREARLKGCGKAFLDSLPER